MAHHANHRTRSRLPANQETRVSAVRRARETAFGLFLPLSTDIEMAMGEATKEATEQLAAARDGATADLRVRGDFGTTFAHRQQVRRHIGNMLGRGFDLDYMVRELQGDLVAVGSKTIDVPIAGFAWSDNGEHRKLMAVFEESDIAVFALHAQADAIGSVLGRVRANEVEMRYPDHVSVATYGHRRDGMNLGADHRAMIADTFEDVFGRHGITSLTLGSLVIGSSYSVPLTESSVLHPAEEIDAMAELELEEMYAMAAEM